MGQRGPAPLPTAVKKLRGNPGKRKLNSKEPRPAARVPSAPRWLSAGAKREYRKVAKLLLGAGLMTEIDGVALGMMCEALDVYQRAKVAMGEDEVIIMSDKGNMYQHPAVGVMSSARADVLRWTREFGMTPSARSRIAIDTGGEEPSLADLLFSEVGGE